MNLLCARTRFPPLFRPFPSMCKPFYIRLIVAWGGSDWCSKHMDWTCGSLSLLHGTRICPLCARWHSPLWLKGKIDGVRNWTICIGKAAAASATKYLFLCIIYAMLISSSFSSRCLISCNLILLSEKAHSFYFLNWSDFDTLNKDETLDHRGMFPPVLLSYIEFP